MQLEGRVALVTGGATGIGRATARRLAEAGAAAVAVSYHTAAAEAQTVVTELIGLGGKAMCVAADVRDDAAVRRMVDAVAREFGRLDIAVNNAGVTQWVPIRDLEALTDAVWDDILDVDLKGAFRCTRAVAPLLRQRGGMVVNVASISGMMATATLSSIPYGTAKAGLMYLTRALAVALAPDVRVNAVAPAFTDTKWMSEHYGADYADIVARASTRIPLGRIATADDVAAAIVGLITGGDFVTGQTLLVDGGLSLG